MMKRRLFSLCMASCLLAWLPMPHAGADELPLRKAGLWEMKVQGADSVMPRMTIQQCTDESTDRQMSTAFSPLSKQVCTKRDVQKTASGYVADSVCAAAGVSVAAHAEIVGDFNSAYTVKSTSRAEGAPAAAQGDHVTMIEAKWLGACKPDQKPGDVVMPGGFKLNIKDAEKLKGLLPK
jgi:hypothetical protein